MDDLMKMMLFVFLGLIVAILVLGYHKSPKASPALGAEQARNTGKGTPSTTRTPRKEPYPSNKRNY